MGAGLKRVSKLCGGLVATSGGKTITYNTNGEQSMIRKCDPMAKHKPDERPKARVGECLRIIERAHTKGMLVIESARSLCDFLADETIPIENIRRGSSILKKNIEQYDLASRPEEED